MTMDPARTAAARRYDLDWLRIGATFLLFPYHVAKVFDVLPIYHLKNRELVPALDYVTVFVHQWHMPLFFVLAGWAAHGTMARRGTAGFLRERVHRLVVPFVTGVVLLCPIIKYLELRSGLSITATGAAPLATPFDESFLAFLPSFFTRLDRFTWSHLWFLLYLFTFSVVWSPLLSRWLRRDRAVVPPSTLSLYLPLLPLALIQMTLRLRWPGVQNLYDDWANVTYYSLFFLLGFVIARRPEWEDVIAREWRRTGALGLAAYVAMSVTWLSLGSVGSGALAGRPLAIVLVLQALSALAGYGCVVGLLGFARRHLAFNRPGLAYLTEASLPIYVLHQLAIVGLGFFVVQSQVGVWAKSVVLLAGSVALTMGVYHLVVRRSRVLAAAFGAPRPATTVPRPASPPARPSLSPRPAIPRAGSR